MVAIESTADMAARALCDDAAKSRRRPPPLAAAADAGRQSAARPSRGAAETQDLQPGRSYLSLRPDRVLFQDVLGQSGMLQFMQTQAWPRRGADHDPLRPSHSGAYRWRGRSARVARREQGGLRFPALRGGEIRLRLLGAGRRDHPSGGAGELCLSRRIDHRHGFAHAERRRARRLRGRRWRRRRRRGDLRTALGGALSQAHRGVFDRHDSAAGPRPRT